MLDGEMILKKRILELADKSYKNNQYLFTGFLSPADLSICLQALDKEHYHYSCFGGTEAAERMVIRFGCEEDLGYTEDFPVVCISIRPLLAKFADKLGHRDFLGSILNLGIERSVIGDIYIRDNVGYVMCLEKMADFIVRNLKKIKHTNVKCEVEKEMVDAIKPVLKEEELSVGSLRCDMILAKLYHISRNEVLELFREKKVSINSRVEESNSRNLKENDVVSARGFGKFIFGGVLNINKKEKFRVTVSKYE